MLKHKTTKLQRRLRKQRKAFNAVGGMLVAFHGRLQRRKSKKHLAQ